jgi:hypothetical protein
LHHSPSPLVSDALPSVGVPDIDADIDPCVIDPCDIDPIVAEALSVSVADSLPVADSVALADTALQLASWFHTAPSSMHAPPQPDSPCIPTATATTNPSLECITSWSGSARGSVKPVREPAACACEHAEHAALELAIARGLTRASAGKSSYRGGRRSCPPRTPLAPR